MDLGTTQTKKKLESYFRFKEFPVHTEKSWVVMSGGSEQRKMRMSLSSGRSGSEYPTCGSGNEYNEDDDLARRGGVEMDTIRTSKKQEELGV